MTEQVKDNLRGRIVENEFEDDRIPSETVLAEELGVSRTTVRDALSRLEIEGVIYRKQGAGTFVNRPGLRIKSRLDEIWSYEEMLEAHGYQPDVKILLIRTEAASSDVADQAYLVSGFTKLRYVFLLKALLIIVAIGLLFIGVLVGLGWVLLQT